MLFTLQQILHFATIILCINKFLWKKYDFCNFFYDKKDFFKDEICTHEKILYLTTSYIHEK